MFCHLLFSHCSTYVIKKPQNKSTYNWHFGKMFRIKIFFRCICGYCNVLCTRNQNLIELFHRPHIPQTIFPQLLNKSTFAMAVACGGATVHKKSVFYCIILRAPKTQSNTGDLVFLEDPLK
ncbi:hypothetical protein NP493_470g03000 [Ridgeia piscesae]|uniref:Uncharacterized protein n=1 Tax=Ridgeia piscesae TaxID=27915 RepID=A0AAD9KYV4_RIDPI|nr:hypothetical protein NP493_470g03000 [Ridgeia piscesae]